jgi:hypothetical protein
MTVTEHACSDLPETYFGDDIHFLDATLLQAGSVKPFSNKSYPPLLIYRVVVSNFWEMCLILVVQGVGKLPQAIFKKWMIVAAS